MPNVVQPLMNHVVPEVYYVCQPLHVETSVLPHSPRHRDDRLLELWGDAVV